MKKELKNISVIVIVIGVILILIGIIVKVPHKELTTHSFLADEYSVIEEYVGGDAYNYIIGAALVSGEIAGVKAQKAVFISIGALISCIGLLTFAYCYADSRFTNEEHNTIEYASGEQTGHAESVE